MYFCQIIMHPLNETVAFKKYEHQTDDKIEKKYYIVCFYLITVKALDH